MFVEHDRQSIRLSGFDYSGPGAYFITICTHERAQLFGRVGDGEMHENIFGTIIRDIWSHLPIRFQNIELDEFVIMPNHIHFVVWVKPVVGAIHELPLQNKINKSHRIARRRMTIPMLVGYLKMNVTKRIREIKPEWSRIWQRNYYERVIRSDTELHAVRRYVRENPAKWENDEYR